MKTIPNALDMAKEVINQHPYLFNPDLKYKVLIETVLAKAMLEYSIESDRQQWEERKKLLEETPKSLFDAFADIARKDAKDRLNIDL